MSTVPPAKLPKATKRRRKQPKCGPSRGRKAATGCSRRSSRAEPRHARRKQQKPGIAAGLFFISPPSVDRVADEGARAARRVDTHDFRLDRSDATHAAVAGKRSETLLERIEAAVLATALVLGAVTGWERAGVGRRHGLGAGDNGEAESGQDGKAHGGSPLVSGGPPA